MASGEQLATLQIFYNYIEENYKRGLFLDNSDIFLQCQQILKDCRAEASKRLVGQTEIIDGILMAMIAGGHVLLEGVPGLAKTLAVKTFADMSALDFKRIQFTPDLLPADVSGTLVYEQAKGTFAVRRGPVFANLVLADEINRAPAKVQSALLEAMAEKQVTIGEKTYSLPKPFFVLATQNPIEQEGTYNLPEAELDRFLLKLLVKYPKPEEEAEIIKRSNLSGEISALPINQVFNATLLEELKNALPQVECDEKIIQYIVSILNVTRQNENAEQTKGRNRNDILKYITFGASPRAGIALQKCAKINAMFDGRSYVLPDDVKKLAPNVLRHRLVLSYEAAADGLTSDDIIEKILSLMPVP